MKPELVPYQVDCTLFVMKCNHCDITLTLDCFPSEIVNGVPQFYGVQCEDFFEHLREHHDICDKSIELNEYFTVVSSNPGQVTYYRFK